MAADMPVEVTSADELRALFNEFVLPRVAKREIDAILLAAGEPSPTANQPPGTTSETVGYYLRGHLVATAHRYVRKDGSVGGSGRPDPKLVVHEGRIFRLETWAL